MNDYQQRKKWHKKLTKIQCTLEEMVRELPGTIIAAEMIQDRISTLQTNLVRNVNDDKRSNVISLATANPTLSMSAIARHYGYSEAFVAKVFSSAKVVVQRKGVL